MSSLKLFNSLTREVEPVQDSEGLVRMFTCGPTVYKTQHVGNMRTFLLSDLIVRRLRQLGLEVNWIVNITDVGHPTGDDDWNEDKLQLEAVERRLSALEIARQYEAEFFVDWKQLNLTPPQAFPRASEHIEEIIELVQELEAKGYGYVAGRDVAFDVGKFPAYGELSGHQLNALRSSEETLAAGRHSPNDFALWRGSGPETVMEWCSPWGPGYPGWHIEDTAIAFKWLGQEQVHVHTGGQDLRFPHHEAEIAQAEAITGHRYVLNWVHGGHVVMEGRKMAKSTGNVITVGTVRERIGDPLALRWAFLSTHYRRQAQVTWESLKAAASALQSLRLERQHLGEAAEEIGVSASEYDSRFQAYVDDDLDLPQALPILYAMLADSSLKPSERAALLDQWDEVLGCDLNRPVELTIDQLPPEVRELVGAREQARERKEWAIADQLRVEISQHGYAVRDTSEGPLLAPEGIG